MNKDLNQAVKPELELKNLKVNLYGRTIVEDVSLRIDQGKIGILLGLNGAGKTTLMKTITGLIEPACGEIYVGGFPLSSMKRKTRSQFISYLPQYHSAVYNYSVTDFITMGRTPYVGAFGVPGEKDLIIAEEVMKRLNITHMADRNYLSLSAGERQMVMLARSLAQEARVVVMDEPTTYLDYGKQYSFLELLKNLVRERNITAIVSLHDPNLAIKFADKIILLHDKKVLDEVDCSKEDYICSLEKGLKSIYGGQVALMKCEADVIAAWDKGRA